jgi:hypothetical protein
MKLKTFAGGLHPPDDFKHFSSTKAIEVCPLPAELIFPLSQHIGAPAECCVKKGDLVKKGQVIATPKGFVSLPIHASTSGEVVAVEPRLSATGVLVNSVVIKPDGVGGDEDIPVPLGVGITRIPGSGVNPPRTAAESNRSAAGGVGRVCHWRAMDGFDDRVHGPVVAAVGAILPVANDRAK